MDGVIRPSAAGTRLISRVAEEQNLPSNWLNDDVRQFLSHQSEHRPFPSKEFEPGLKITIPTATYLLALKLNACRKPLPGYPGDEADIRFLLGKLKPITLETVETIHHRFFPGEGLPCPGH